MRASSCALHAESFLTQAFIRAQSFQARSSLEPTTPRQAKKENPHDVCPQTRSRCKRRAPHHMPMSNANLSAVESGPGLASWYTPGRSDGFGDRLLMFDNTDAVSLELLRFRCDLAVSP